MDFTGKVVLITGASSGLGAAGAVYFAKYSAKLALVGRNEKNLQQTASLCEKEKGIKPLTILADITVEADVERIVKETIDKFGQLDVLVNNSGIISLGGIKQSSLDMYDKVMNTNLRGSFHLTQLAVPHLIKSKGSIVNVSSISSTAPYPRMLVYAMSKAAMDHFTRNIACELGQDGVRVNAVNPGFIPTNIMDRVGLNDESQKGVAAQMLARTPLGRLADTTDVAAYIAFLASDLAKSVTGTVNPIDGGRVLF